MSTGVNIDLQELISLQGVARSMHLGHKGLNNAVFAGNHLSMHRGRGMEFDEVRIYQAGDDIRTIDWRVTARRGKTHTKLFQEEREQPLLILVDLGPTMFFGSRYQLKSVLAARAAALNSWSAMHHGNRVGGVAAGTKECFVTPPRTRRAGVLPLLNGIVNVQPRTMEESAPFRLDKALAKLVRITPPSSMVLLISDFRDLGPEGEKQWHVLARRNEVLVSFIYDHFEQVPPARRIRMQLGTPKRRIRIDTGFGAQTRTWSSSFTKHRNRMQNICRETASAMMELNTAQKSDQELLQAFHRIGGVL